jgi:hypothetical protein
MGRKKPSVPADDTAKSLSLNLNFSFQYYDTEPENIFCFSVMSDTEIKQTLARLKDICSKTFNELRQSKYVYHFNPVVWEKTIFPDGFPEPIKELNNLEPFHFKILGINNGMARVFGAYSQSTFYVVWFDYDHEIWPTPKKNT